MDEMSKETNMADNEIDNVVIAVDVEDKVDEIIVVVEDKVDNEPKTNEMENVEDIEMENAEDSKKRKKTSNVWNFIEEMDQKKKDGSVVKVVRCIGCKKTWLKQKSGATSQLLRHVKGCFSLKLKAKQNVIPFTPDKVKGLDFSTVQLSTNYDHKKIREIIAKMIIVHEYPFRMVEHQWFNILMKSMNCNYTKISKDKIKHDCMNVYEGEKEKMKNVLKNVKKVSLTSDTWTSSQTIGYMCVTIHFVDAEWKVRSHIISFCELAPPHTGVLIARAISNTLIDWNLQDKVQAITLDNATTNDVVANSLKKNFMKREKLHFKGHIFHVRCCAHILNILVQDGLKEISSVIHNVRETVKYFKKSPSRLYLFGKIAKELDVKTEKGLCLDVPTRWNSTYKMLEHAFPYKSVFEEYVARDPKYVWLPNESEWLKAEKVMKFLVVFNSVTKLFSGTSYYTSNLYLVEIWRVKHLLDKYSMCEDDYMQSMAKTMASKFQKYWGDCNLLMCLGTILDPRYKLQFLKFIFPKLYSTNEHMRHLDEVKKVLYEIYDLYVVESEKKSTSSRVVAHDIAIHPETCISENDIEFEAYCDSETPLIDSKTELDKYLEEARVKCDGVQKFAFDVLEWWKINSLSKPTMSKMARDILSIPLTSVASEAAFSTGGRVLDQYRSSLLPKTVEALVCSGNWLRVNTKTAKQGMEEEDLHVVIPNDINSTQT